MSMNLINRPGTGERDKRGRWTPGKSGNPAGRPPEPESLTAFLRSVGAELVPVDTPAGVKRMSRLEAIARRAYELADSGSVRAVALILERLDGKPTQSVEVVQKQSVLERTYAAAEILAQLEEAARTDPPSVPVACPVASGSPERTAQAETALPLARV